MDQTVAANFLGSDIYEELLEAAISNDIRNGTLDLSLIEAGFRKTSDFDELKKIISNTNRSAQDIEDAIKFATN